MKKIWKVFKLDFKRLSNNVVALVIIMGLSIIPALYAWFNIMSNWNPYGEEATSSMKISVFSEDKGFNFGNASINVGDKVIESLSSNKTINWQFDNTKDEALNGVYSGEYYAALVIPKNFTISLMSFIGGNPIHPSINYYENSKRNAIATKITSKVKTTVQQSVNATVVSSIAGVSSKIGEAIAGEDGKGQHIIDSLTAKLNDAYSELNIYVSLLNGFILIADSSSELVKTAETLLPVVEEVTDNASTSIDGMKTTIKAGAATASSVKSMLQLSIEAVENSLKLINNQIESLENNTDTQDLQKSIEEAKKNGQALLDILNSFKQNNGGQFDKILDELNTNYSQLVKDIKQLSNDSKTTQKKLNKLIKLLNKDIKGCQDALKQLKSLLQNNSFKELDLNINGMLNSLSDAQLALSEINNSFPDILASMEAFSKSISDSSDKLVATRDYIYNLQNGITLVLGAFNSFSTDQEYEEIFNVLSLDSEVVSSFVSSPISIETETYYEISTYGSAMAPFYTVLALWVGGLILVALIHVKVKDCKEIKGTREGHKFFGRYLVFFLVGQAQTLITVLGNLFFVNIQCLHPFRFWLAAAVSSFMFTFFMYALTYAWGNVGQAVAVIVMVIQVAGAGGTFPIEVLPKAFQVIYKFLPFTYSMNSLRECVGGMYRNDYWKDLGVLGIYILCSVVIGLLFGKPFKKLIEMLEESKKKSGIMM